MPCCSAHGDRLSEQGVRRGQMGVSLKFYSEDPGPHYHRAVIKAVIKSNVQCLSAERWAALWLQTSMAGHDAYNEVIPLKLCSSHGHHTYASMAEVGFSKWRCGPQPGLVRPRAGTELGWQSTVAAGRRPMICIPMPITRRDYRNHNAQTRIICSQVQDLPPGPGCGSWQGDGYTDDMFRASSSPTCPPGPGHQAQVWAGGL